MRYFIYAIGEIILVIIGILIAININNYDQRIKSEERVELLLDDVRLELQENIEVAHWILVNYRIKDSIYPLLRGEKLTYQDYNKKNNSDLFEYISSDGLTPTFDQYAFDNLMHNLDAIPDKYQGIVSALTNIYNLQKRKVYEYNNKVVDYVENNLDYQIKNYAWVYGDYNSQEQREKRINYYLNDSIYRNAAGRFNDLTKIHIGYLINFRKKSHNEFLKISSILNKPTELKMFDLWAMFFSERTVFVGSWESEQIKGTLNVYKKDKRLLYKINRVVSDGEFYFISHKTCIGSHDNRFYTILRNESEFVLVNYNDNIIWKKVKSGITYYKDYED